MFEQLGSDQLSVPVATDIAGKSDTHAVRLDREATDAVKKARLHQRVASSIFFEFERRPEPDENGSVAPRDQSGGGRARRLCQV